MQKHLKHLAFGILASALAISPASAKGGNKGGKGADKEFKVPSPKKGVGPATKVGKGPKGSGGPNVAVPGEMRRGGIQAAEARRLAKQYKFGGYKPLPPGIRKNLMRGKPLPPGIARTRLPAGYLAALPVYQGYEWRGYGSDLVLVAVASNLIADVIMDVLK